MCKQTIRFCPCCGKESLEKYQVKAFKCKHCDFLYYHNVAATSSAIILVDDEILMVYRAKEPFKGTLDFPGGFIEKSETAEQGLTRELEEELDIKLENTGDYICNFTNEYKYCEITYQTLDLYFLINLPQKPKLTPADDVASYEWLKLDAIKQNKICFDSVKNTINYLKKFRKNKATPQVICSFK